MSDTETQKNTAENRAVEKLNIRELFQNLFWFIFALAAVFFFAQFVGFENLQEKAASWGIFGPILLALLKASTIIFAPLGGAPLYPAAGALFGFTKGFIIITIGDFIGATVAFFLSRKFGKRLATYFISKPGMKAAETVLHYLSTTKGIAQARILFAGFPEAVHYAAGLTEISYTRYMSINMTIGIFPTAALVAIGSTVVKHTNSSMVLLASIAATLIGFLGAWWIYRQAKKLQKQSPP